MQTIRNVFALGLDKTYSKYYYSGALIRQFPSFGLRGHSNRIASSLPTGFLSVQQLVESYVYGRVLQNAKALLQVRRGLHPVCLPSCAASLVCLNRRSSTCLRAAICT